MLGLDTENYREIGDCILYMMRLPVEKEFAVVSKTLQYQSYHHYERKIIRQSANNSIGT